MTMPPPDAHESNLGVIASQVSQILSEQGKQSTLLAVVNTKLDTVVSQGQDHEQRIRDNTAKIAVLEAAGSAGRDLWARIIAAVAVAAALGSAASGLLHH